MSDQSKHDGNVVLRLSLFTAHAITSVRVYQTEQPLIRHGIETSLLYAGYQDVHMRLISLLKAFLSVLLKLRRSPQALVSPAPLHLP